MQPYTDLEVTDDYRWGLYLFKDFYIKENILIIDIY
jgi:hypothetical protein